MKKRKGGKGTSRNDKVHKVRNRHLKRRKKRRGKKKSKQGEERKQRREYGVKVNNERKGN